MVKRAKYVIPTASPEDIDLSDIPEVDESKFGRMKQRMKSQPAGYPKADVVERAEQHYMNCPWQPVIIYADGTRARLRMHYIKREDALEAATIVIAERRKVIAEPL